MGTAARILKATFLAAVIGVSAYEVWDHVPNPPTPPVAEGQQPVPAASDGTYASKRGDAEVSSRPLTAGEQLLAKGIFGDSLDTSQVRLHFYKKSDPGFASDVKTAELRNVEFYGGDNFSDDYSKEKNPFLFGAFAYEMTHLWQNQHGADWRYNPTLQQHDYLLGNWTFGDYGAYQQRAVVEDYARRFLHESRQSRWIPNTYSGDRFDTDPFLEGLVEGQFPAAKDARIAFAHIQTRSLTQGEIAFITSVFGKEVDVTNLRVVNHPEYYSDRAGSVSSAQTVDMWGDKQYSTDYSTADAWRKTVFIHEVTHVWQYQADWRNTVMTEGVYRYPLDIQKWSFNDYMIEQQAAMVEDYVSAFMIPGATPRWLPQSYSDYRSMLPALKKVVEDRFPALRPKVSMTAPAPSAKAGVG